MSKNIDEIMRGQRIVYAQRKKAPRQCEVCGLSMKGRAVVIMIHAVHLCEPHGRQALADG